MSTLLPELASSPSGTGSTISAGAERLQGMRRLSNIIALGPLPAKLKNGMLWLAKAMWQQGSAAV